MILVADSGSTKTSWALVDGDATTLTEGLNPLFTSDDRFLAACDRVRSAFALPWPAVEVCFYGAGCGDASQRSRVEAMLVKGLGTARATVATDMLGACRASCGHRPGVVGILGTGSNCCCYDGAQISFQAPSTGFILGDHGSANHVGRLLLHDYLSGRMPADLSRHFLSDFPLSRSQFLDAVYRQPNANRFLASLAPFALRHADSDYCASLLDASLDAWYEHQLAPCLRLSEASQVCLVGGFAAALASPLRRFALSHAFSISSVLANPLQGLLDFHRHPAPR